MTARARQTLGALIEVEHLERVLVSDHRAGMHGSSTTRFDLRLDPARALVGTAWLFEDAQLRREVSVALAPAATADLLGFVAAAPLTRGRYRPHVDHTDDFPCVEVVLDLGCDGFVSLYSASQGPYAAPWGVSVLGDTYTSKSDHLGRAVTLLRTAVDPTYEPWG